MSNTFMDYSSHVKLTKIINEEKKGLVCFDVIDYELRRRVVYQVVNDIAATVKHIDSIAVITDNEVLDTLKDCESDVVVKVTDSSNDVVSTIINALPSNYDRRARVVVLDLNIDFTSEEISELMSNNIVIFNVNILTKTEPYIDKYKYTIKAVIPQCDTVLLCDVSRRC